MIALAERVRLERDICRKCGTRTDGFSLDRFCPKCAEVAND